MSFLRSMLEAATELAAAWPEGVRASAAGVNDVLEHLDAFGYIDSENGNATPLAVADAIRRLQRQAGLEPDGVPGVLTQRVATLPRCGVREHLRVEAARWNRNRFSYSVASYVAGISPAEQDAIFREGCAAWSRVAAVSFEHVPATLAADLVLSASTRRSEDFGHRHGVLAWAEMPASESWGEPLRIKFDDAELWRADPSAPGVLLLNVFTHELGHALGLGHSNEPSALMAPYYNAAVAAPVEPDDRSRMSALYGEPSGDDAAKHNWRFTLDVTCQGNALPTMERVSIGPRAGDIT